MGSFVLRVKMEKEGWLIVIKRVGQFCAYGKNGKGRLGYCSNKEGWAVLCLCGKNWKGRLAYGSNKEGWAVLCCFVPCLKLSWGKWVICVCLICFLGKSSDQDYILRLRSRLHSLPEENLALLKYIICFLVAVASHHDANKMGPMALAIVFGPNIFRYWFGNSFIWPFFFLFPSSMMITCFHWDSSGD